MKSFAQLLLLAFAAVTVLAQDPECPAGTVLRCCDKFDEIEDVEDQLDGLQGVDINNLTGVVGENCVDPTEDQCGEEINYACCLADQPDGLTTTNYTIDCEELASTN